MFLSKLCLNLRDADVRRQVRQPYEMHRTLWSTGFRHFSKEELGRVLFRVDTDRRGSTPVVLVQSERLPDWAALPAHLLAEPPQCKPFDVPLLTGQRLRFRLRANPTKKIDSASKAERLAGTKKNGRRIALLRENDQIAWLLEKGRDGGFTIPGEWQPPESVSDRMEGGERQIPNFRVDVVPEGWVRCGKEDHRDGSFFAVRFDGILIVTEPSLFRETLQRGIGSAKGFGFGLLSLAPVSF
jgi:CRISPR system Cascade subunit CasE